MSMISTKNQKDAAITFVIVMVAISLNQEYGASKIKKTKNKK